jgi:serralysin
MATISVPGGSFSSAFGADSITVSTVDNATFQNALVSLFNSGFNASSTFVTNDPNPPSSVLSATANVLVNQSTGAITLASAFNGLANEVTTGSVTVTGNSGTNESIVSAGGNFTFYSQAGESGTLIGAGGNTLFTGPTSNGGSWTIDLTGSSGANTIVGGSDTLMAQDGTGQTNVMYLGSGADSIGVFGTDTLVGQSGNDTVWLNSGGNLVYGGSGTTVLVDQPSVGNAVSGSTDTSSTFVGGSGNSTIFAMGGSTGTYDIGSGSMVLVAESGSAPMVGGAYDAAHPSASAVVFAMGGSNVTFNSSTDGNILVAAGANATLNAAGSDGANVLFNEAGAGSAATLMGGSYYNYFIAGAGNATMAGGSGPNFFQFFSSNDGGSNLITGWNNANDQIDLNGYSASQVQETVTGGSTVITLSDGTKITVQGVTNLPSNDIKIA